MDSNKLSEEELRLIALDVARYELGYNEDAAEPYEYINRRKIKVDKAQRTKIFQLKAEGEDIPTIANELGLLGIEVEVVIERDQNKIRTNPKWKNCFQLYKDGESLETIGKKYNITRERVRQICNSQLAVELGYGPAEAKQRKTEINTIYRSIVQGSREERVEENVEGKLNEALDKGLDPQYFDSFLKFTSATGIRADNLKKFKPDVYNEILQNQRRKKQRWSTYYDACRMCGLTINKHSRSGYCVKCYAKTPEWKEMVKLSNMRNKETRQIANKKFREEYMKRPEVIEKYEHEYDLKFFGGNRKAALERDGHKCIGCGMSTDTRDSVGRAKVKVWHLNGDNEDNALENLGTYCQSCLFKTHVGSNWKNFKRKNRS